MQALSLENIDFEDSKSHLSFMRSITNATLTFSEFALLSASILPDPSSVLVPIGRLQSSLDLVIDAAHSTWSKGIVDHLSKDLKNAVAADLAIDSVLDASSIQPLFKNTWREKRVFLDEGEGGAEGYSEVMCYPTRTSSSLSRLFFKAVAALNTSVVSADTLHRLPNDTSSDDKALRIVSLTDHASNAIFTALGIAVLSVYDSIQIETNRSSERLAVAVALKYKDYSVQAIYDILVSETLLKKFTNLPTVAYADVAADWKERLDPVDEALIAPLLLESAQEYIARSKFLLPGSSSGSISFSTTQDESNSEVQGSFGETVSRFTLLPLAFSTTVPKGLRSSRKKEEKPDSAPAKGSEKTEMNPFIIGKAFEDLTSNLGNLSEFGVNIGSSVIGNFLSTANDALKQRSVK